MSASNPLSNPHYLENMKPEGEHYYGEDGEKTLLGGLHTDHIFNIFRAIGEHRVALHPVKMVKLLRVLAARDVCPDFLAWRVGLIPVVMSSTGNLAYKLGKRFGLSCHTYASHVPCGGDRVKLPNEDVVRVMAVTYEADRNRFLLTLDRVEVNAATLEDVEELFPGFAVTVKE